MGCKSSKQRLKRETALTLASNTHFSEDDVFALHGLFRKLSSSLTDDGLISKEEFEIGLFRDRKQHSLLADRIFHLFDFKNDGVIEFEEFVRSLSVFHPDAPKAEKIAFSFRLYDIWQTDFIEREVVKELILAVLNESDIILPDNVVESIVDKTFQEADSKGDGKIDIDEWNEFASRNPNLLKNMTIPYLKDIPTAFPSFTWESDM